MPCSLSIGIRRALSRCILPLIYVSTFILLHSYWKIKPVFNFEKYDRKREPFRRKGSLLRFWYHWEFRTLRNAPKGFALGTHKPFVKGLTENFFLPKPDTPMIIGVSLTFVEWARAKKVFCPFFSKKGAGSRGTGNVSETHMRNRQGTPCGGSLRPNFVWSTLLRFWYH